MMRNKIDWLKVLREIQEIAERLWYLLGEVDGYVLLTVINAWRVSSLDDKDAILRWIAKYDECDYLNRYDTSWEMFIDFDILTIDEVENNRYYDLQSENKVL